MPGWCGLLCPPLPELPCVPLGLPALACIARPTLPEGTNLAGADMACLNLAYLT